MKKILIVDDVESNRELLADILSENYEVDTAADGKEAIDKINDMAEYSMILLDLMMPNIDGFGVLDYMKEHHLDDIYPVIVISGDSDSKTESRCFDYAISDFIAKPFKEKIILKRIGNIIRLKEAIKDAENANESKTSFLFNMSHDIRTPMNAIIGFTNLMDQHIDDTYKLRDYLSKIKSSSDILLSLINNVLEIARIESGHVTVERTFHRTGDIFHSMELIFGERMKSKNITFSSNIEVFTEYLMIDELKVSEIILNLMSNAYKYTLEDGAISLNVKELPYDKDNYALFEIKVSDTGIGMSEEFLPHIFDEFSREISNDTKKVQGTGLGMGIVKQFVTLLGGTISVQSKLGQGTIFTVLLPCMISTEKTLTSEEFSQEKQIDCSSKRLLLVEDNELNAEIAMEVLGNEGAGFMVEHAENGKECVDMLSKVSSDYYDVVLMDIQMPLMDGYTATKIIRQMDDPIKSNIPIIAMTANAFEEDKKRSMDAGMNGHISKPIDVKNLLMALTRVLK